MIYFGDPDLVQKHLHEDLNTIIKNVKIRQEQHLELLEYNKTIATKKRSIESTIFINDEITTHNKYLEQVLQINKQILKEQHQILQKYDQATVKFESVMKLMARVVARILQTNHSYIDKIKVYDEHFNQQFIKMKNILTKLVNNKEQIDLSHSTKAMIQYTQHKALNQIEKLKNLIKSLEDGELQKIPYIYKGTKNHPVSQKSQVQKNSVLVSHPQKKIYQPPKRQQKQQKSFVQIKQQLKQHQKLKKNKKTLAHKLMGMYSTLDLSRKEFMEDMVFSNAKEQYDRLYNQIFHRNKFNHEQILEFESKKQQFEEKVRHFKQIMIEESNRIQQVLMIKKTIKVQKKQGMHSQSASKLDITSEQNRNPESLQNQSPNRQPRRAFVLRQKVASPRFHKQAELSQFRITQQGFNHIRFDTSNQQIFLRSNRNRLPSIQNNKIYNHSTDSQHRYHMSKKKEDNKPQRKNILMKNIEVGVQNVIKNNQNKNKSQSKNIAEKIKQIHPSNPSNNNALMQLTFYGAKRNPYSLNDTRTNFAF